MRYFLTYLFVTALVFPSATRAQDQSLVLCFAPDRRNLLSIDDLGELLHAKLQKDELSPRVTLSSRQLSPSEMKEIRALVSKATEGFLQNVGYPQSEVISISEVASAPPQNQMPSDMVVWRFWLDGQAWEFYGRGITANKPSWNPALSALEEKMGRLMGSLSPSPRLQEKVLVVFEKPRQYFIPNLPELILHSAEVKYSPRPRGNFPRTSPPDLDFGLGSRHPGILVLQDPALSSNLKNNPEFISEASMINRLIKEGRLATAPAKMRECPIVRENLEVTIWIETQGSLE